ncbi:hypothetical protein SAY86_006542 [Trapa natans]|uniref:Uncharacterized protein n=1 Tax=Trapa natans TaxID=22666 RepID=A0AAN7QTD4_TRANT|nr:hypothetical protein SAY86_006542 [Trapa natans]
MPDTVHRFTRDKLSSLSGFYAVHSKLNLSHHSNFTDILEKGQQLCSRLWNNSSFASETGKYGEGFCFQVPYMVIEDTFGLQTGGGGIYVDKLQQTGNNICSN